MKAMFFREDGTVTIFCALLMTVLILFFMVLIDMSRIYLIHRTTESALKLSAQSVISAYDRQLYTKYGLFGRGGSDAEQLFRQTLELNLMNSLSLFSLDQGSDFAAPHIEELAIYETEYLGQHHVFERQVLEEMKYKGPIDFTLELLEQWLPLQDAVTKAEAMISIIAELQKLYEEREGHLKQALSQQQQLGKLLTSSFQNVISSGASSTLIYYPQYISRLAHGQRIYELIQQNYDTLDEKQLQSLLEDASKYDTQISSYQRTASNTTSTIIYEGESLLDKSNKLAEEIDSHLQTASALDQTMQIKYELYLNEISKQKTSGRSQLENELDEVQFDETMLRGEDYFKQYRKAATEQHNKLNEVLVGGLSLASTINGLVESPNLIDGREDEVQEATELSNRLQEYINHYRSAYSSPATLLQTWEDSINSQQAIRSQMSDYEEQFEEEMLSLHMLMSLLESGEHLQEARGKFEKLGELYQYNKERNAITVDEMLNLLPLDHEGQEQAKQSTSQLSTVLQLLASAATAVRDEVYINEYIMGKFSSFPVGDIKISEGELSPELLEPSSQEIEYILYGVHEPIANVLLAFGEIFTVRFAIRTIEGFIANRALGHPLLILSAAVAYGARHAVSDMRKLINDGKTVLSKYAPIDVSYEQYLRLFLLLHVGGKTARKSRMVAVIEQNTGLSLLQVPTSITASAQMSMRLWSMPGLAQITNILSSTGSEVDGNEYKNYEMVTASY